MAAARLALLLIGLDTALGRLELPSWEGQSQQDDYDVLKFHPDESPGFRNYSYSGVVSTTGRAYTAHVALLSTGFPETFSFQLPLGG